MKLIDAIVNMAQECEAHTRVRPFGLIFSREDFDKLKAEIYVHDNSTALFKASVADTPMGESCIVDGLLVVPTKVKRLGRV